MASEAMGRPDPSASTRHDAASSVGASSTSDVVPQALDAAIGYESADPVLHAPLWIEAMHGASHGRRQDTR
jgi:hypothetical protein